MTGLPLTPLFQTNVCGSAKDSTETTFHWNLLGKNSRKRGCDKKKRGAKRQEAVAPLRKENPPLPIFHTTNPLVMVDRAKDLDHASAAQTKLPKEVRGSSEVSVFTGHYFCVKKKFDCCTDVTIPKTTLRCLLLSCEPVILYARAWDDPFAIHRFQRADPTLELHEGNGTILASNDNWADTQQADIQASGYAPPNAKESAIVITRPADNTTAIVRGENNTIGNALVEVYTLSL